MLFRSGIIFGRKEGKFGNIYDKINAAVFPMLQGGPHEHQIAGIATQMREVATPEFKAYIKQVKANAKALAKGLMDRGQALITNGTDNHLILMNLRPLNLTGSKMEKLYEKAHITVNKNTIAGDKSAVTPGGIRIGTPAMTTRGCTEQDMDKIAEFLVRGTKIGIKIQEKTGKKLKAFLEALETNEEVKKLNEEVKKFSKQFDIPGFDASHLK